MARKCHQGHKKHQKGTFLLKTNCTMVELFYHIVSALQEQQENWIGKALLFKGNTKLEGKDKTAWINLMSCPEHVKNCQALIEAFTQS